MWQALKELHCNADTMYNILAQLERLRYFVDARDSVLQKLLDRNLPAKMQN